MSRKPSGAISRRTLFKSGAGAVAAAMLPGAVTRGDAQADRPSPSAKPGPRNIIFMVSDGMSPGVPALAEAFSWLVRKKGTVWHRLSMDEDVARGWFDMASLNSLVTDSAAASSAWGSGSRVFNWAINTLPDGRPLKPIAVLAKQAGRATGLVTTTRVTHATPAGFAAVTPDRDREDEIASQYLNIVDVVMGGGRKHFDPAVRKDHRDVPAEFRAAGYAIHQERESLIGAVRADRILGMFDADHVPYSIDRNREESIRKTTPTLAEMSRVALEALVRSPNGFLLQIEGGRVDHAAHNNDAAAQLWDQLAFDDAIEVVLEFVKDHPDTLIVIASDHGTGNPGLNGMGATYQKTTRYFEKLAGFTASYDAILERIHDAARDRAISPDDVLAAVVWGTSIQIKPAEAGMLAEVLAGKPAPEVNRCEAAAPGMLAQVLGNHTGIGWTGLVHTSDWTISLALGPGSERFAGLLKNTDAFSHMTALMGIEFRNPAMTAEEAAKLAG